MILWFKGCTVLWNFIVHEKPNHATILLAWFSFLIVDLNPQFLYYLLKGPANLIGLVNNSIDIILYCFCDDPTSIVRINF
jgi:hypothetical protein